MSECSSFREERCVTRQITAAWETRETIESPTTSQPQANQLNQSIEDDLAQVVQITPNYELESGHSLRVKGNLKNNLGFWRSIGVPVFFFFVNYRKRLQVAVHQFAIACKAKSSTSCRFCGSSRS